MCGVSKVQIAKRFRLLTSFGLLAEGNGENRRNRGTPMNIILHIALTFNLLSCLFCEVTLMSASKEDILKDFFLGAGFYHKNQFAPQISKGPNYE
jgi:hypothetical protein